MEFAEIERLQEKCSEITFAIACGGSLSAKYEFENLRPDSSAAGSLSSKTETLQRYINQGKPHKKATKLMDASRALMRRVDVDTEENIHPELLKMRRQIDCLLLCHAMDITSKDEVDHFMGKPEGLQIEDFLSELEKCTNDFLLLPTDEDSENCSDEENAMMCTQATDNLFEEDEIRGNDDETGPVEIVPPTSATSSMSPPRPRNVVGDNTPGNLQNHTVIAPGAPAGGDEKQFESPSHAEKENVPGWLVDASISKTPRGNPNRECFTENNVLNEAMEIESRTVSPGSSKVAVQMNGPNNSTTTSKQPADKVETLQSKIRKLENDLRTRDQDFIGRLEKRNKEHDSKLRELKADLERKVAVHTQRLQQTSDELTKALTDLQHLQKSKQGAEAQLKVASNEISKLQDLRSKFELDNKSLQAKLNEEQLIKEQLTRKVNEMNEKRSNIDLLKNDLASQKKKVSEAQQKLESVEARLAKEVATKKLLEIKVGDWQELISGQKDKISEAQQKLESLDAKLSKELAAKKLLESKIEDLQQLVSRQQENLSHASTEQGSLRKRLEQHLQAKRLLEESARNHKLEQETALAETQALKRQLQQSVENCKNLEECVCKYQGELEAHKGDMLQVNRELDAVRQMHSMQTEDLATLKVELEKSRSEHEKCGRDFQAYRTKSDLEMSKKLSKISALETEKKALDEELEGFQKRSHLEMSNCRSKISELDRENKKMAMELETSISRISELECEKKMHCDEFEGFKAKTKKEISNHISRISELEREKKKFSSTVAALQEENKKILKQLEEKRNALPRSMESKAASMFPPSPRRGARKVILFTGFKEGEELADIKNTVESLGGEFRHGTFSNDVTHCIAKGRTAKMLKALLAGLWVMREEWIEKSKSEGKFLSEAQHGRRVGRRPFEGMRFYLTPAFGKEAHGRNPQLVKLCKSFVKIGGGRTNDSALGATHVFVAKGEESGFDCNTLDWESFLEMIENLGTDNKKRNGETCSTPNPKRARQDRAV